MRQRLVTNELKFAWILFLIILVLSSSAVAGDQSIPMAGVGAEGCARYIEKRRTYDQDAFDGEYAYAAVEWVRGYASGYNYAVSPAEKRRKAPLFSSAIVAYLDNYCRSFPTGVVEHGARCLLAELNNDIKPCGD